MHADLNFSPETGSDQVSQEEGMAKPSDNQLEFTLRLFDLNQDKTLTTDEMLTSLALDAVVRSTLA